MRIKVSNTNLLSFISFVLILQFHICAFKNGATDSEMLYLGQINRRTLICAVNQDPEESFKKTVEVDRLIDMLRDANPREVSKLVFSLRFITFHSWDPYLLTYSCSIFFHVSSCRSLLLKMSLLSMRAFGYDLLLELIPVNRRMIKHVFDSVNFSFL